MHVLKDLSSFPVIFLSLVALSMGEKGLLANLQNLYLQHLGEEKKCNIKKQLF